MGEVVDFSGLGNAMNRPLNTYSSGMRARLAFSIATLRTPEILLLDEALAVGDRSFRERSIAKINEIRKDANTIILVSHNLNEIRETCNRAIWLNDGVIEGDGGVDDDPRRLRSLERPYPFVSEVFRDAERWRDACCHGCRTPAVRRRRCHRSRRPSVSAAAARGRMHATRR